MRDAVIECFNNQGKKVQWVEQRLKMLCSNWPFEAECDLNRWVKESITDCKSIYSLSWIWAYQRLAIWGKQNTVTL